MIAVFALASWPLIEYHRYAYALVWHCVHGHYADVGGHTVKIPTLWWKEADPNAYATSLLVRSCPANMLSRPEIVVRPTLPGEAGDDDLQELRTKQAIIALKKKDAILKSQLSLVTIKSKPFTLYCVREDAIPFGVALFSNLSCHAARTPYSFTYNGGPTFEKEAESILSTLE
jgi:hypothetical protein